MKRKSFLQNLALAGALPLLVPEAFDFMKPENNIRLLRHATLIIHLGKLKILVDPMLSAKDAMDPVQNSANPVRIPMVDLPVDRDELNTILKEVDAVVITHTHRDHWDTAAQNLINKSKLIFCQPSDTEKIKSQGFLNVQPIDDKLDWQGITISRTNGKHGTGETGKAMGTVSGFVFNNNKDVVYVAGDTIWCDDVAAALQKHIPTLTILNAGAARFLTGDPITMTPQDIINVQHSLPSTKLIAVHMDTVNHCLVKRADLKKVLDEKGLGSKVLIPSDGETINLY